jgi:hypothetical protein
MCALKNDKTYNYAVRRVDGVNNYRNVAAENVRASREKSGNQQLANLPTCYYKYVYVILCSQSCPILRGINILSSTVRAFFLLLRPLGDNFCNQCGILQSTKTCEICILDPGSWIRDPGSKIRDPGSEIRDG